MDAEANIAVYDRIRVDSVEFINELNRLHGWSVLFQQLEPAVFRGCVDVRAFGHGVLARESYNARLSISSSPPSGKVAVAVGMKGDAGLRVNGLEWTETSLLLIWPGAETYVCFPQSATMFVMHFEIACFLDSLKLLYPSLSNGISTSGTELYMCRPDAMGSLRSSISQTLYGLGGPCSAEEDHCNGLRSMAIHALASAPCHTEPSEYDIGSRRHIAMAAREYIDTNYDRAISLDELCCGVHAGARTMERAIMQTFGTTIRSYMKMRRLNAAHTALVSLCPESTSVTEQALNCGFTHLGRFSVEYKELFGESPSVSLLR